MRQKIIKITESVSDTVHQHLYPSHTREYSGGTGAAATIVYPIALAPAHVSGTPTRDCTYSKRHRFYTGGYGCSHVIISNGSDDHNEILWCSFSCDSRTPKLSSF